MAARQKKRRDGTGTGSGGYHLLTVADLSRLLRASKAHVRTMCRAGLLPAPLELGVGGSRPGQVQRWRPEAVAETLGIPVDSVLASVPGGEQEAGR